MTTDSKAVGPGTALPWGNQGGTVFGIAPECCGRPQTIWGDDGHGNPMPVGEDCCGSPVAVQVGPIAECPEQDAAFIVRAANSHFELLEALEEAFDFLGGVDDAAEIRGKLLNLIRKASDQ